MSDREETNPRQKSRKNTDLSAKEKRKKKNMHKEFTTSKKKKKQFNTSKKSYRLGSVASAVWLSDKLGNHVLHIDEQTKGKQVETMRAKS